MRKSEKVHSEDGNIPIYGMGGLIGYATTALYDKHKAHKNKLLKKRGN